MHFGCVRFEKFYTHLVSCAWRAQRVASNRTRTGGRRGGGGELFLDLALRQRLVQLSDAGVSYLVEYEAETF